MTDSDIYWTFISASKYGGSFWQRLADAGLAADAQNKRRILNEFYELIEHYGPSKGLHQLLRNPK